MSNGSVHVTVDSSAVAAAVSRLKGDIRDVADEVRGVTGSIQTMRDKLVSQLGANGQRLDAVKNEVTRSIDAAALSKLVETASEIFAKIGLIEKSKKRILQQYHKSIVRCSRTSDKFDRLNDEVKDSYHLDIRRLGKYIFDIWYNHYHKVEDRIDKQHTGFLTTMEQSVEQIRKKREKELEENLGRLLKKEQISKEYHELLVRGLKKNPPKAAGQFEMPRSGENLHTVIHPPVEEPAIRQIEIEFDEEPGENEAEEEEMETQEEEES